MFSRRHSVAVALVAVIVLALTTVVLAAHNRTAASGLIMPPAASEATTSVVSVTSAGQTVLAANADRLCVVLVNDSDTDIYLKLGAAPALNSGIRLNAQGGSYAITAANCYTGSITAVCDSAAGKKLLVTEY